MKMRFLVLSTLLIIWKCDSTASLSLQDHEEPCRDLSSHCPSLCTPCSEVSKWPQGPQENDATASHQNGEDSGNGPETESLERSKRYAGQGPPQGAPGQSSSWFKVPTNRPSWLPSWILWPKQGQASYGSSNNESPQMQGPPPMEGPPAPPSQPDEGCDDLFNGGRELVESFCPKSCGNCGRSSDPLAAARTYIGAQCTVAQGNSVGLALH